MGKIVPLQFNNKDGFGIILLLEVDMASNKGTEPNLIKFWSPNTYITLLFHVW